jgi:Tripartite tricarboxylate transporter TctB family
MPDPMQPERVDGVCTSKVETVVALAVLAVGLVTALESWRLGARWTDDGPGAGYFPFYIGLVLCFASLGILLQALRSLKISSEVFVDSASLRRVLQVLLPALVYVGAIQLLGIYVASALYIALFMVLLGKYPWLKSLIVGVAVTVLFFAMFEVWFKVPLFKGALDPTGFLGY